MLRSELTNSALPVGMGVLVAIQGIALWLGAVAHTGARVDLGVIVISEPQIIPAVLVEAITGFLLIGSAYAIISRRPWAWTAAVVSQIIALGGVLLGMTAIALGAGPHTTLNTSFRRAMVVVLLGGIGLALTTRVRESIASRTQSNGISE